MRTFLSLLALFAVTAVVLVPSSESASACKRGFVKNNARKCVKKPPAGVAAPGFYKFAGTAFKGGLEVRYTKGKFVALVRFDLPASRYRCTDNTTGQSARTVRSDPKVPMRIASRRFSNPTIPSEGGGNGRLNFAQFTSAKQLSIEFSDTYSKGEGLDGPIRCAGAVRTEVTLKKGTKSNL